MNLKEFLRPTKWKVILFVILLLVPLPVPVKSLCNCAPLPGAEMAPGDCECPTSIILTPLILIPIAIFGFVNLSYLGFLIVIAAAFAVYVVACGITFAYGRLRKTSK